MDDLIFTVDEAAVRLDRYIAERRPGLSRSLVQRLIKEKRVLVNGQPAKASDIPSLGDVITLALEPAPHDASSPAIRAVPSFRVVYEDEHLMIIDKPAGVVVHPGAGHQGGTLVDALVAYRPDLVRADLDTERPGIVHRLDKDTSGLMVIAAQRDSQLALQAMFKARLVHKVYLALVQGRLVPERGAIEAPLGRNLKDRKKIAIRREDGRYARTEYAVREYLPSATFLEAMPLTGRTHQLRVHLASIGHPVVGDRTYGRSAQALGEHLGIHRQFLHAWRLSFAHPVLGTELDFTSELPCDLAGVLEALQAQARS